MLLKLYEVVNVSTMLLLKLGAHTQFSCVFIYYTPKAPHISCDLVVLIASVAYYSVVLLPL